MIREMVREDVPQIAGLERLCFSYPWSEASVAGECANPCSFWLVAEENAQVVGYVGSQLVPPEADVMNLAVAPEWRKHGMGNALMEALEDVLRSRGIHTLFLEVRVSNESAKRLYAARGFRQVGCRPKYYENPVEDALILRKELTEC